MTPFADALAAIWGGHHQSTTMTVLTIVAHWLIAAIAWAVADWVWFRPKKLERLLRQQGLTGNSYRLYYGDLKEAKKLIHDALSKPMDCFSADLTPRVRPLLHQSVKTYGNNCFFWEGPVPVVSIGEPYLIREVLSRYNEFQKAKANPVAALIARGVLKYEGEKWERHRKFINPAFYMEKLKLMLPSFYTSAIEMVNKWETILPEPETQQEVDVHPYLATMSADVISRAAFGSSYEEGRKIFQLLRAQMALVSQISLSVYFPGLKFLPTKQNKQMWDINRQVKGLITGIIEKRKKENKDHSKQDDLLGLLLSSTSDHHQYANNINHPKHVNKQKVTMTTDELIEECKLFYLAGQETTSTLITWTMILLAKHQQWQTKAREEVLATFGNKPPNFEGLNHLKIMTMILHEVLRLYTAVPEIRRSVVKSNTKLGNLSLPAGILITLPAIVTHHDHEQWGDDVHEFNPERFCDGIFKAPKKSGAAYFPFGWGPRICVGSNFALIEAKVALTMILQRFQFNLSPSYSHAPVFSGILVPEFGAPLILRRLSVEFDTN